MTFHEVETHAAAGPSPLSVSDDDSFGSTVCRVETYALAVPLSKPPADSHAFLTHWTVPVVEITTQDGLVGTGISGVHTGADILLLAIDNYLAHELLGRSSADLRAVWHRLRKSPLQWIGRAGATHMALAMIDIALWDLAAQRTSLPLWRLLGGHHRRLSAYHTDGGWLNRSIPELIEDMGELREQGWAMQKMKVGKPDWREDVARITAVREAFGGAFQLACDANKHWDLATAMKILPHLEKAQMEFIEEPMHPDDVRAHRTLQAATGLPIALGESLYSHLQMSQFLAADAVRLLQPDVTRIGVTEYLEVAAEATAIGIPVVPHAGDMAQVHQHLAAAGFAETPAMIEYLPWARDVYEEPCDAHAGIVILPTQPGASTRIRPDARAAWSIPGVGTDTFGRE